MVNSRKSETILLRQLMDAIMTIETDIAGIAEEDFLSHHTIVKACLMMLVHVAEIIFTMKKYRADYEFIDDGALKGMRNIIAHDYLTVRGSFVQHAIYHKLPLLKQKAQQYMHEFHDIYIPEEIIIHP
jgi:uncharacterized protein with HEPN domain